MESLTGFGILLILTAAIFLVAWFATQKPKPSAQFFWRAFKLAAALGILSLAIGQIWPGVQQKIAQSEAERNQKRDVFATQFAAVPSDPNPETCARSDQLKLTWSPADPYYYPLHKCLDLERPSPTGEPLVVVISQRPDDAGIIPFQKLPRILAPWGGWNIAAVNSHLFDERFTGWDYYQNGVMIFLGGTLQPQGAECKPKIVDYIEKRPTWQGTEQQLWPVRWPHGKGVVKLFVPAGSKLWLGLDGVKCPGYFTADGQKVEVRPDEVLGAFKFLIYVENR